MSQRSINRLRNFIAYMVACILAVLVFLFNAFPLSAIEGEHTYYLYSPSSQAKIKSTLDVKDALFIKGESVCFSKPDGKESKAIAHEIARCFDATIVVEEYASGVMSYYAFSPRFIGGMMVQGVKVNLHIAISNTSCVVGSPIIFGGF